MSDEPTNKAEGEGNKAEGENNKDNPKKDKLTIIDEANAAAERLENANKEQARLLARQEQLEARRALGGMTDASEQEDKKEETPAEYRKRVMKEIREGKYND